MPGQALGVECAHSLVDRLRIGQVDATGCQFRGDLLGRSPGRVSSNASVNSERKGVDGLDHRCDPLDGDTFGYEYDLGDGWEHEVLLEKLVPAKPSGRYPACLDGARTCPLEDCGGTSGYEQLIDTLADPNHPDHQDMLR